MEEVVQAAGKPAAVLRNTKRMPLLTAQLKMCANAAAEALDVAVATAQKEKVQTVLTAAVPTSPTRNQGASTLTSAGDKGKQTGPRVAVATRAALNAATTPPRNAGDKGKQVSNGQSHGGRPWSPFMTTANAFQSLVLSPDKGQGQGTRTPAKADARTRMPPPRTPPAKTTCTPCRTGASQIPETRLHQRL